MNTTLIILGVATYLGAVIVFFSLLSFGREIEEAEVADGGKTDADLL